MDIKTNLLNSLIKNNKTETHYVLNLLGLKLKFPKKLYKENRKRFNYFKNNNLDITTYPKATGQLRDVQLANFELLKFVDQICSENNLKYWLDFGSLLGAARHKGFIPWDDDIDISMMREDYEKVVDIINSNQYDSDIYAEYHRIPENVGKCFMIKVRHKKCEHLFVDIFPSDYLGKVLPKDEQIRLTEEFRQRKWNVIENYTDKTSNEEIRAGINKLREEFLSNEVSKPVSDITWGIDFYHYWNNWIHPHDMIFPLSEIEFEGKMFPCPNDVKGYLSDVYGDYMGYPEHILHVHSAYMTLSDYDKKTIEELKNNGVVKA